jgi:hypothetical protein
MFSIFDKLGGEQAAISLIAADTGEAPTPVVIRKWKSLGRIPAIRAVALLDECVRRGIPASYSGDCVASRLEPTEAAE